MKVNYIGHFHNNKCFFWFILVIIECYSSYFFIYLCAYFVQNDEKPYLLPYFIINHVLM